MYSRSIQSGEQRPALLDVSSAITVFKQTKYGHLSESTFENPFRSPRGMTEHPPIDASGMRLLRKVHRTNCSEHDPSSPATCWLLEKHGDNRADGLRSRGVVACTWANLLVL